MTESLAYQSLCTQYYDLDKPDAPQDVLEYYAAYAEKAKGPILEPMSGSGRFLIPLMEKGYHVEGIDTSSHMLEACVEKCRKKGLTPTQHCASILDMKLNKKYELIFIPAGSFGLLTDLDDVQNALKEIHKHLSPTGKFIFEVETFHSRSQAEGSWNGFWIDTGDGSKIVANTLAGYQEESQTQTVLCRYELWENNQIVKTEVEEFRIRLYATDEMDRYLSKHGFDIIKKTEPYTDAPLKDTSEVILYECTLLSPNS